jgi:hypothetical protein
LGAWKQNCNEHREWQVSYDPITRTISKRLCKEKWRHYDDGCYIRKCKGAVLIGKGREDSIAPKQVLPAEVSRGSIILPTWTNTDTTTVNSNNNEWSKWIKNLEEWEYRLLSENTTIDEKELERLIDQQEDILVCSDGGCIEQQGSFGWVVGSPTKDIWTGRGVACGNPMSSFRAEGYGKLAAIDFIRQYLEWQHKELASNVTVFCDNKGLNTRIEQFDRRLVNQPRYYTEPDQITT